jgi:hypothetical protein
MRITSDHSTYYDGRELSCPDYQPGPPNDYLRLTVTNDVARVKISGCGYLLMQNGPPFGFPLIYTAPAGCVVTLRAYNSVPLPIGDPVVFTFIMHPCRRRSRLLQTTLSVREEEFYFGLFLTLVLKSRFNGASGLLYFEGKSYQRNPTPVEVGLYNAWPDHQSTFPSLSHDQLAELVSTHNEDFGWQDVIGLDPRPGGYPNPYAFERNHNYLPFRLRCVGLILMVVSGLLALASMILLFRYRRHRLIIQANHKRLQILCVGSAMISLTIMFLSFDEGSGLGVPTIDAFCSCAPWMLFPGQILVGLTLNKLKWCSTQEQPTISSCSVPEQPTASRRFCWTIYGLGVAAAATLMYWTIQHRLRWERVEITPFPPETAGSCSGAHAMVLFAITVTPILALYCIAFYCSWKQVDGNNGDQRSGTMIVSCTVIQAYILGIPMLVLVRSSPSPAASYFVEVLLIWTVAVTILAAMVWPVLLEVASVQSRGGTRVERFNFRRGQ